ncbi:MAG: metal-dependent transcriptional regulator [Coriobacteriaceae bacterium]|jgi:Mn-dependent DtxR family transcriptional regulator|nr:metal-dependent transcriptional regulator [Olsenella sp.]MCI1289658.1 metal-dependent transcriptional regulator [Olsenella sp.]RRF89891.1 MAG: metal-dependent transcriptional regulator [Coriobacteriaceae bacterium]
MENVVEGGVANATQEVAPEKLREGAGEHLSKSNEDYIESIYRIMRAEGGEKGVRSVDVAEQLDVSKASVNKAVTTLRNAGYVEQNRYGRIQLTDSGVSYARRVWRCHRMLRSFLERDLGVDPKTADAEACLMEHALSPDTQDKWLAYLEKQGIQVEE